jgi:hypothetical protein
MQQSSDKATINENYGIPQEFYAILEPYLGQNKRIIKKDELIDIWSAALEYAKLFPQHREHIAEWTMSVGAHSPFTNDNDIYEAIHLNFGSLEVADSSRQTQEEADSEWREQGVLFLTLLQEQK